MSPKSCPKTPQKISSKRWFFLRASLTLHARELISHSGVGHVRDTLPGFFGLDASDSGRMHSRDSLNTLWGLGTPGTV